jgi:hypothetical protein
MKSIRSEEKKLAQEGAAQIRKWAEEKKLKRTSSCPRLAIKFCGGCNPEMDRSLVAQVIHEELLGMVQWELTNEKPDLLLIIQGCSVACADRPEIKERAVAFVNLQNRQPVIIMGKKEENNPEAEG